MHPAKDSAPPSITGERRPSPALYALPHAPSWAGPGRGAHLALLRHKRGQLDKVRTGGAGRHKALHRRKRDAVHVEGESLHGGAHHGVPAEGRMGAHSQHGKLQAGLAAAGHTAAGGGDASTLAAVGQSTSLAASA